MSHYHQAKKDLTSHQFSLFLINYLGELVKDAESVMREYARLNPRHQYNGREQDPRGVHGWIERFDALNKETPNESQ